METVACNPEYNSLNSNSLALAEGMNVAHRKLSNKDCIIPVEEA